MVIYYLPKIAALKTKRLIVIAIGNYAYVLRRMSA
jgi:hypothetical protein